MRLGISRRRSAGNSAVAQRMRIGYAAAGICLAMLLFFVAVVSAQPSNGGGGEFVLGDLRIGAPRGYVNDFAGVLTSQQNRELESICRRIDQETNAQIAIVTIPDLAGETAGDVKTRLFETWKIGHKGDNRGLLILHAIAERRVEVEVGYDLEGAITDARAGRILDQAVVPSFRTGNYYEGYRNGLVAFYQRIGGDDGARAGDDAYRGSQGRTSASGRQGKRQSPWLYVLMAPLFIYLAIRHPRLLLLILLSGMGGGRRGRSGGGGFGGGFGGFGGGMSGGGGAGRSY